MPEENISMRGFKELEDALKQMGDEKAIKAMQGSMRKGMKIVLEDAKQNAPVSTGALRDSLKVGAVNINRLKKSVIVQVITKLFYARFIEYGTALISARPFMRHALEKNRAKVLSIMREDLNKRIERFFKKTKLS
jgi:HK97 gp10 family phage protein